MTELEYAVLEAAIDFEDSLSAWDAGCPAQEMMKKAKADLRSAVSDLHSEHDGRYRGPEKTLEDVIGEVGAQGFFVNNLFQLEPGRWRANITDGEMFFDFGEGSTAVSALRAALDRRGSGVRGIKSKPDVLGNVIDPGKIAAINAALEDMEL